MSPSPVARAAIAALLVSTPLFLAGCGGGSANDPTSAPRTDASTAAPQNNDATTTALEPAVVTTTALEPAKAFSTTAAPVPEQTTPAPETSAPETPAPTTSAAPTRTPTTPALTTVAPTTLAPTPAPCPVLPASACVVTATHGCLDGEAFPFATRFACGPKQPPYNRLSLYDWASSSCCAQGIPFDPADKYCCYDGIHAFSAGECVEADYHDFREECRCYGSTASTLGAESVATAKVAAIDTLASRPHCPCGGPTETRGCLNGHLYRYDTQMPCGNHIADMRSQGCCPTASGIEVYDLEGQSCCKEGDASVIHNYARACQCRQYDCESSMFSAFV